MNIKLRYKLYWDCILESHKLKSNCNVQYVQIVGSNFSSNNDTNLPSSVRRIHNEMSQSKAKTLLCTGDYHCARDPQRTISIQLKNTTILETI